MPRHTLAKLLCALLLCLAIPALATGCSGTGAPSSQASSTRPEVSPRASITASDGTVLAESKDHDGVSSREYPLGAAAAPLLGSLYDTGGAVGIEQNMADKLEAGSDVTLTIDPDIQKAAFEALGEKTGTVVVMEPDTGAVLAMASTPSYDPENPPATGEAHPMNKACEAHIPGSTFKTVTLAAALESGKFSAKSPVEGPAQVNFNDGTITNYDYEEYPRLTLEDAYANSVNTAFALLTKQSGLDEVAKQAERCGFGKLDVEGLDVEDSELRGTDEMTGREEALSGIGQASFEDDGSLVGPLMTPLEGAFIASAVVNGGAAPAPHVVKAVGGEQAAPADTREMFSAETARSIRDGMAKVVRDGTGKSASVKGVTVGGKTGTAETPTLKDDGWFIGYAEKGGEAYALSVMVEDASSSQASEVAAHVIEHLFE